MKNSLSELEGRDSSGGMQVPRIEKLKWVLPWFGAFSFSACDLQRGCESYYGTLEEQVACLRGAGDVAENLLLKNPKVAQSGREIESGCREGCVEFYNPDSLESLPDPEFRMKLEGVIREFTACTDSCAVRLKEGASL